VRGELKTKVRPLVEAMFGFESGQNRQTITKNRALVEELKDGYCFVYEVRSKDVQKREGLYKGQIIQKVINAMWFANKRDEGVLYPQWFSPISIEMLALVLTAVCTNLTIFVMLLTPYLS
jgi:hypothetical protein